MCVTVGGGGGSGLWVDGREAGRGKEGTHTHTQLPFSYIAPAAPHTHPPRVSRLCLLQRVSMLALPRWAVAIDLQQSEI